MVRSKLNSPGWTASCKSLEILKLTERMPNTTPRKYAFVPVGKVAEIFLWLLGIATLK